MGQFREPLNCTRQERRGTFRGLPPPTSQLVARLNQILSYIHFEDIQIDANIRTQGIPGS